jgi:hypothetical protein
VRLMASVARVADPQDVILDERVRGGPESRQQRLGRGGGGDELSRIEASLGGERRHVVGVELAGDELASHRRTDRVDAVEIYVDRDSLRHLTRTNLPRHCFDKDRAGRKTLADRMRC